jgi:hypothetical protein
MDKIVFPVLEITGLYLGNQQWRCMLFADTKFAGMPH